MRTAIVSIAGLVALTVAVHAQTPAKPATSESLTWRLLPPEQPYAAIDGPHLKDLVDDQTAMSRRYRDSGHQFWGRISGTEADAENARWLLEKFRQLGLSDVREQAFDLPPQWMPQSWSVAASGGAKSLELRSAQPTYLTRATPAAGLDLEAVDVGSGSEGDLTGRDLRGKAVFFASADILSRHGNVAGGAIKRIADRGAAAIFVTLMIPGNLKLQFYPVGVDIPTFALGLDDGMAVRDMIGRARGGAAPRVKIWLDVNDGAEFENRDDLGFVARATDETIVIVAHRDGWFEAANDNATGVATLVGLAEYFAKIPRDQRRRTIVFLGTSGHHDSAAMSGHWLAEHKEFFANTALLINAEHTAEATLDILRDPSGATPNGVIRQANSAAAKRWYVGGSPRLRQLALKAFDAFGVATYAEPDPQAGGEIGLYFRNAPALQVIGGRFYWHSDHETSDVIPAPALAGITRAYAKIIDDVNGIDLNDLRPVAQR